MESYKYLILFLATLFIGGTAAYAGLKAAPWLPVYKRDIKRIVDLAALRENDMVYDLGSGDGRIVVALAHNSAATLYGYEVSLLPYVYSWFKIILLGLWRQVHVRYGNFFRRDLHQATVVFCFLTPKAMLKLRPKFARELAVGTRVISYSFAIPGWRPTTVDKPDDQSIPIYSYIIDEEHKMGYTNSAEKRE